ncbi:aminopeptidase YwaD precursor [Clostridium acetireducens DSM 10703]|uniref:Aminopeptidase YwaD n=1 Tax=Clostridium acetireducens DSM 10703 TaxID=1121290 RepID=A0A1E8EWM4_9CLOT|nr:M28 family metallopeptidase [Clostridium acetireducens]OFI05035.1 aminopeptidase YwaD precursor [Clostridium acetireducens DSM 10703]
MKFTLKYLLCVFLILLSFNFSVFYNIHHFNYSTVKNHIDYLSSENFKGRLAGTLENEEAASFIKESFKKNNLLPYKKDFYHSFLCKYPCKIKGNPYLKILDKNNSIVKEFSYGIDYKEDMINFRNNNVLFSKDNSLYLNKNLIKVTNSTGKFLFYNTDNNNLNFRSSFIENFPIDMVVMVTDKTLSEIKYYLSRNYSISCFIPFCIKDTKLNNVVGYIKGKKDISPIIISAHFDHVGYDLNNNTYPGALDNASGISFVIEFSKYIKSLGQPTRDIIFIGFNAEEFGCLGSKNFAIKNKKHLKNSKVFNYDMIGSMNAPLCIMGGKKDSSKTPIIKSVSSSCSYNKINFNYLFQDSSDHESFRNNNIEAITFIDNDTSKIHTPKDKASFININAIKRCFKVSSMEIIKQAFNNNLILIYYKQFLFISIIGSFVCIKLNFKYM